MIYLRRLGLISIIVVDAEDWSPTDKDARSRMNAEVLRLVEMIENAGGSARPILQPLLKRTSENELELDSLFMLRSAIKQGEIPVLPPVVLDSQCQAIAVRANEVMLSLAKGLANTSSKDLDLTPLRIMVINREGGIPSHARGGTPHLGINLASEHKYIHDTFQWQDSHPTALSNLDLTKDCLAALPKTSSALIVSHRSPKSLIANLVTNRPAHSPSLHMSALPSMQQLQKNPTVIRHGLPIKVFQKLGDMNLELLTALLEGSFGRTLDREAYYERLSDVLDFAIVAGDANSYAAVAIVTREGVDRDICYLDKFAALPSVQGDGTTDFLWGALRDESFGLGLLDALNNNGGREGKGSGVDLVWRSRADNLVNKWYFERSNGFSKMTEMGKGGSPGMLFWCDAEQRILAEERGINKAPFVLEAEHGRLEKWVKAIAPIPSCWKR